MSHPLASIRAEITGSMKGDGPRCLNAINIANRIQHANGELADKVAFAEWLSDLDMMVRGAYPDSVDLWDLALDYASSLFASKIVFPEGPAEGVFGMNLSIPLLIKLKDPEDKPTIKSVVLAQVRDAAAAIEQRLMQRNSDIIAVVPNLGGITCSEGFDRINLDTAIFSVCSGSSYGEFTISPELNELLESRVAEKKDTSKVAEFFHFREEANLKNYDERVALGYNPPVIDEQYLAVNFHVTAYMKQDALVGQLYLMESETGSGDMWTAGYFLGLTGELGEGAIGNLSALMEIDRPVDTWVEGPVCFSCLEEDIYSLVNRPYMDIFQQARESGLDEPVIVMRIPERPEHPHALFGPSEARVSLFDSDWDSLVIVREEDTGATGEFCPSISSEMRLSCPGNAAGVFVDSIWPSMANELRDTGLRVISTADAEMRGYTPPVSSLIRVNKSYA